MLIFIITVLRRRGRKTCTMATPAIKQLIRATWMNVASALIVSHLQFYMVSIKLKGNFFRVLLILNVQNPCV